MISSSVQMFMQALLSVASYMMKVANLGSYPQHKWFDTDWQENMKTELKKNAIDMKIQRPRTLFGIQEETQGM